MNEEIKIQVEEYDALHKALSDAERIIQELEAQLAGKSFVIHVMFGVACLVAVVSLLIAMWGAK